ncbi:MAG: MFS transporter [Halanaerobiales bacterium]|nr:MFS transporter [Halanaerobiales bacterium]
MKEYIRLLFKNKNFLIIMIADLVSRAGDILFTIALLWTVIETTKSVFSASIILFIQYFSRSLSSVVSGLLVDMFSRKKLLVVSLLSQAGLLLLFIPFVQNELKYLYLTPLIFLLYIFSTIARQTQNAMIPDFVEKEELVRANSIDIMLNRIVGIGMLAAAGYITSLLKISTIMWVDSISFVIPALLLLFLLSEPKVNEEKKYKSSEKEKSNWVQNLQEGWEYIKTDSFISLFLLMLILLNLPYTFMNIFPLAYVNKVLAANSSDYGLVKSMLFVGTLISMYIVGKYKFFKEKPISCFTLGIFGCGISLIFFAPFFQNSIITVIILLVLYEFFDTFTQPIYAIFRGRIPSELRGRVLGLFDALALVVVPIYTLLSGYIMDQLGIAQVGVFIAILFIILGFVSIKLKYVENVGQ